MGKIQIYKKFQNSKSRKISFWLKQIFIDQLTILFCRLSSKSTVTNSLEKCDHCTWIWDISEDPPIAHTIDIYDNDYMINWPYFCNETSSKSTVTNRCQKVWPLHVDLGHFGRPPIAHSITVTSFPRMTVTTHTHTTVTTLTHTTVTT